MRSGLKAIFHALICYAIFFVSGLLYPLPFDLLYAITETDFPVLRVVTESLLFIAIFISLAFLYIRKVLKRPLGDFLIRKPKSIFVWIICAVALPLSVCLFFTLFTPGVFAMSELIGEDTLWTVLCAVFFLCLAAGITEEITFRGMMMRIIEERWGKAVAVIAPSVVFALVHLLVMESFNADDVLLLTLSGTIAGVMFSLIALRSRSVWPGALVHGIWNLVIIGEILQISVDPYETSIFTYTLSSESVLLTGGAFGIEASIPAIAAYAAVILIIFIFGRRELS